MEYPARCDVFRKQFASAPAPAATEYEKAPSDVEAFTHVGPPGWADGAATFFDLGQYAEHLSSVATEAGRRPTS